MNFVARIQDEVYDLRVFPISLPQT